MVLKNANILVIDDDTDVLTAVKLLLKTEAKEVITEKNPELIHSLLASKKVDIVLLDMNFKSSIIDQRSSPVMAILSESIRYKKMPENQEKCNEYCKCKC